MPEYSINDLAKLAEVTPRTIRFYVSQGLLPSPDPQGPKTTYTDEHLERLLAIKRLQAAHLPLAEIRNRLGEMAPDEVSEIAEAPPATNAVRESAADYVRRVLAGDPVRRTPASRSEPPPAAMAPPPALPNTPAPSAPAAPGSKPQSGQPELERSQWDRYQIGPDVEITVRRPLTRSDGKKVFNLIAYARQLFREEK